ncbi:hypothetical protein PABG_03408 [Paracoccidioides brasiliensis Pb03]|nr:hypothetical protein PABG_03408 [Paracoccidioides brasiliensis Pb03]
MSSVLSAAQPQLGSAYSSAYNSVEGGSFGARILCRAEISSRNTAKRSMPYNFGLSTPPEDMTGIAVKQSVSSSNYGPKTYGIPSSYSNSASERSNIHLVTEGMAKNSASVREQQPPSLTSQVPETRTKESSRNSIATYLQIPASINPSKGSLAEFAAQITCLFWFEKASKLNVVLNPSSLNYSIPPLMPESTPTVGFRKWVTTILSTTQVSQNVILLALLFIYRLKKFNPTVRGKRGSEFRLMTIALMMANKFLDDNTYTNKTWAEVSGISAQEIHIMEVEFLSNVRYNLFVTKNEWDQWHTKLGMFADYFAQASRLPPDNDVQPTTPTTQLSPDLTPISPTTSLPPVRPPKLPSPVLAPYVPLQQHLQKLPPASVAIHPNLSPHQLPWTGNSNLDLRRKRSWEEQEHPAKRVSRPAMSGSASLPPLPSLTTTTAGHFPPITMPSVQQLGMPVASSIPQLPRLDFALGQNSAGPTYVSQMQTQTQLQAQLPPSTHSMAPIYPSVSSWSRQTPPATTLAPLPRSLPNPSVSHPDQPRRQSPYVSTTSTTISPALSAYSAHTPTRLSPSFVIDRNSPYRPVRQVNTLLYPPPSASMNHVRLLPLDQMHYQPLGKAVTERKTGLLPYSNQEPWGEPQLPQLPQLQPNLPGPQRQQQPQQKPQQQQPHQLQQPLYRNQPFR